MALKTDIQMGIRALLSSNVNNSDISAPHGLNYGVTWSSGTVANTADVVWSSTRTLNASATEDLDLAGSLTGTLGGTVTFARVKAIMVTAHPANTNNVVIGAASATQFVGPFGAATHTISVQPGGEFSVAAPGATAWPVTAGTADLLKVANSAAGSAVTYTIIIIGASA